MSKVRALLWPGGAVLFGLVAEASSYGFGDPRHWVPDLMTGWVLIGCGLIGWSRHPSSRTGPLLAATGAAWFAGNVSDALVYLHRGPLIHVLLCYPRGKPNGRLGYAAVGAGYAAAVITPLWDSDVVAILLAGGILAAAAVRLRVPGELERATRAPGATAAGVFALVLAGSAAARLVADAADVREPTLLVYELTLCAIAVGLLLGLDRGERARAAVADLVVDLGEQPGTLRDALARALGDPSLEIGFWLPGEQGYVNADGRPLEPPDPESGQRVTELAQAGAPVAVLVHDPAVLDEPELVEALAAAARLAAANAELQASVRGQVAEVAASRRRLVRAGAEERHRLEERLHAGAQRRLEALRESLEESRRRAAISEIEEPIAQAQEQLERALAELRELAAGLHPLALAERGLRDALRELAVRFPLAVDVAAPAARFPIEVEATVYFVCSEALANAAKHAEASRVWIDVADRRESLTVRISDDGRGGANTSSGSGLRGLIDRVEALGGRLEISSPPDRGTVLSAAIPLTATPSGQA